MAKKQLPDLSPRGIWDLIRKRQQEQQTPQGSERLQEPSSMPTNQELFRQAYGGGRETLQEQEEEKPLLPVSKKEDPEAFSRAKADIRRIQSGQPPLAVQEAAAIEQQRQQEIAQRIGAQVSPMEQAAGAAGFVGQEQAVTPIDMKQLGLSVARDPSVLRSIGAGWGVGALVAKGATKGAVAGPWGVVIGAVGGLAIGVFASVQNNIKSQKRDNIAAQRSVLTDGRTNLNQLISLINLDPQNSELYIEAMNQQLNNIAQAHSQLKTDTQSDLNLALSLDGTRELQRFENFYAAGGGYDLITTKAQAALAAPDSETGMRGLLMSSTDIMGGGDD